jgi:hypothetical protein
VTVRPAGGLGHQRLDRPAEDLVRGVAEDLLGGAVAEDDVAVLVRGHHAIARRHQDLRRGRLERRSLACRGHTRLPPRSRAYRNPGWVAREAVGGRRRA